MLRFKFEATFSQKASSGSYIILSTDIYWRFSHCHLLPVYYCINYFMLCVYVCVCVYVGGWVLQICWCVWNQYDCWLNFQRHFGEVSTKFKKFQRPMDFESKMTYIKRILDEIERQFLIEMGSHDPEVIQRQLSQCMVRIFLIIG